MERSIGHCCVVLLTSWVLASCGDDTPKPKVEPWIGKRFVLDVPAIGVSNWTKPSGSLVGNINNYDVPQFLFGVEAGTGDDLVVTLTGAREGVQDVCAPTTQTTTNGAAYPESTINAAQFPIRVVSKDPTNPSHIVTTIHDVTFTNILPGPDNTTTGHFEGVFDFAELATFLDPNGTEDEICQMAAESGSPCQTCAFNGAPHCMPFEVVNVGAVESVASIKQLSSNDIHNPCSATP